MSYQVLARKWRPQRFDEVVGQRGVTQTLRNAIGAKRIAQSFVFAGPRGVGKTTTARILARGLNCVNGPTADPCGVCDACIEIAQGRDIDVLEIDAATNTQVDKVREIIIAGLAIAPVRNRFKIFIIDEVHRLSAQAFDALLKSIEEPPPHVVFMMATTELEKVPPTIQSRSQVFELKTIGVKAIADQLRKIADAEQIQIEDAALALLARAGDGSMRDAESAFDQVIAFAGTTIIAEDVTTVLGLVRRDLLLEIADAVAREDGAAVFELASRAVEAGYDLRLVIRELARLTRDLLIVRLDPSRVTDPEIAAEGEREALKSLAAAFSNEDLMRAFDVMTKAEYDIKGSMQPRYHLELALLRWIHLRRLVPLSDLLQDLDKGMSRPAVSGGARPAPRPIASNASTVRAIEASREAAKKPEAPRPAPVERQAAPGSPARPAEKVSAPAAPPPGPVAAPGALKDALLAEIQKTKKLFYGTVIAQAQRIDVYADRVVLAFGPQHRIFKQQVEQNRPWLDEMATRLAGHPMTVTAVDGDGAMPAKAGDGAKAAGATAAAGADKQSALKQKAMEDSGVQAMLDVFGTDIKEVEEM
ncbi:MAG TPA: DNA polymerase III subunit gamma/tau [Vicinamibacterales bacterium]|nr:DNA polymerase III subunit gamma/tau [Vicinamibacterales bacterium]